MLALRRLKLRQRSDYTRKQMRDLLLELKFEGVEVTIDTDRHVSIQRPAG